MALEGVLFTTAALTEDSRTQCISKMAHLGAKYTPKLSSETTIMVVGKDDEDPKLDFCISRRKDVTLVRFHKLMKCDSTSLISVESLDKYCPWLIFKHELMCLSRLYHEKGFYSKDYIMKLVTHFGSEVKSSFRKDKTTVVVSAVKEGARYKAAVEMGLTVVHPQWVLDSCTCLSLLPKDLYDITKYDSPQDIPRIVKLKRKRAGINYSEPDNELFREVFSKDNNKNRYHDKKTKDIFKGILFAYSDFDEPQAKKVIEVIKNHGGEITDRIDQNVSFLVVPSNKPFDSKTIGSSHVFVVTEWFIQRCINYQTILKDSWSLPRPYLDLTYHFKIHITGFGPLEHHHIKLLVKNLGLTFQDELTSDCSFLICELNQLGLTPENTPALFKYKPSDMLRQRTQVNDKTVNVELIKKKINSAKSWSIPIVSLAFLWEMSETGVLPEILDPRWLIFGPPNLKPDDDFLQYTRNVTNGTFQTQPSKRSHEEEQDPEPEKVHENDISQHNSPTKIISFANYPVSPSKKKLKLTNFIDGNKINSLKRLKSIFDENREDNNDETDDEDAWWKDDKYKHDF